jgi:dTDP-4-amino-4,6-dideoxygalactose transaminase
MFENEVTLPLNSKMSEDDAYYVCSKVKEILGE